MLKLEIKLDEVRKYGKEENFFIDIRDTERVVLSIKDRDDIIVPMDEASFNELREKINEAYELRQM
ncbi:hypothetical protein OEG88_04065 [Clostridium perfringens]|uniref:hypothetical protein n=1 Tax=Clostridium perfringens TaxID=1502 RepID=UPI001CC612C8|nr:hypothetical protein [Clostridium perfringens]MDK0687156.1 hypothetical protein [Clostridium perfringens]MDK0718741.1 hypothetical protein [Clostridium perfringens]UYC93759.1 hypothetical protein OEG88_04065 [Clostridium perfringens]